MVCHGLVCHGDLCDLHGHSMSQGRGAHGHLPSPRREEWRGTGGSGSGSGSSRSRGEHGAVRCCRCVVAIRRGLDGTCWDRSLMTALATCRCRRRLSSLAARTRTARNCPLHVHDTAVDDLRLVNAPLSSILGVQRHIAEAAGPAVGLNHGHAVQNAAILRKVVPEQLRGCVPGEATDEEFHRPASEGHAVLGRGPATRGGGGDLRSKHGWKSDLVC
mmetsp:Transcript_173422/g.550554  ORF Transcript_173422/g.550554 Transcript_173422/m.550554 type:complete len:217 (-) Transcript_173422:24-674(-)